MPQSATLCRVLTQTFLVFSMLEFVSPVWAEMPRPPNILVILTDDQGWPTLGCYGSKRVSTPHLDRLAAEGIRFTAAYVTPQCTPTRGALLTGQHPARSRLWHVLPWYGSPWAPVREPVFAEQLPRETFTVAKGLKAAGYATACIGKWHLTTNADGNYDRLKPEAAAYYGFDTVGAAQQNSDDKQVTHLTDEAIRFIDKQKSRPWFCLLAHHTVHGVVAAPAALVEKHRRAGTPAEGFHNATYLAALEHLDDSVGRLLTAVNERGLREQTLVVFLSDNGGVSYQFDVSPFLMMGDGKPRDLTIKQREFDNTPLRGTKGSLYEGGIRVPCLVRWPGRIAPGTTCDVPIQATDWLPTLLSASGAKLPAEQPTDGIDLAPLLGGKTIATRPLYWYAPLYDLRWGATPAAAIRADKYKLIEFFGDSFSTEGRYRPGHRMELYDLSVDPSETNDLTSEHRVLAEGLQKQLHEFLASVRAELPQANPAHDPMKAFLETRIKPDE